MVTLLAGLELARNELLLFAGVGLLIGGLDDLALDCLFIGRKLWRDLTVYTRFPRMTARDLPPPGADLPPPGAAGPIAIFVPAWDEVAVIGPMLRRCLALWAREDMRIFVGLYPNDPASAAAVAEAIQESGEGRVIVVVNPAAGTDDQGRLPQSALGRAQALGTGAGA